MIKLPSTSGLVVALLAATLGGIAVAQHFELEYGQCIEGHCQPNAQNFGFYQTRWRRWPTAVSRPAAVEGVSDALLEQLPAVETPDPAREAEIAPRSPAENGERVPTPRSADPPEAGGAERPALPPPSLAPPGQGTRREETQPAPMDNFDRAPDRPPLSILQTDSPQTTVPIAASHQSSAGNWQADVVDTTAVLPPRHAKPRAALSDDAGPTCRDRSSPAREVSASNPIGKETDATRPVPNPLPRIPAKNPLRSFPHQESSPATPRAPSSPTVDAAHVPTTARSFAPSASTKNPLRVGQGLSLPQMDNRSENMNTPDRPTHTLCASRSPRAWTNPFLPQPLQEPASLPPSHGASPLPAEAHSSASMLDNSIRRASAALSRESPKRPEYAIFQHSPGSRDNPLRQGAAKGPATLPPRQTTNPLRSANASNPLR